MLQFIQRFIAILAITAVLNACAGQNVETLNIQPAGHGSQQTIELKTIPEHANCASLVNETYRSDFSDTASTFGSPSVTAPVGRSLGVLWINCSADGYRSTDTAVFPVPTESAGMKAATGLIAFLFLGILAIPIILAMGTSGIDEVYPPVVAVTLEPLAFESAQQKSDYLLQRTNELNVISGKFYERVDNYDLSTEDIAEEYEQRINALKLRISAAPVDPHAVAARRQAPKAQPVAMPAKPNPPVIKTGSAMGATGGPTAGPASISNRDYARELKRIESRMNAEIAAVRTTCSADCNWRISAIREITEVEIWALKQLKK